ncbi:MAG TPA: DUF5615 family PIN-like protein [Candidatus Saccharimonadales bacterium]|nr:DUF5615 family PIN-like protein [Candidatus Saccharimonadales bacterium]
MPPRTDFKRLNHVFDVKHISIDLKKAGISDEKVHQEATKLCRLIVTFNGDDFKDLAKKNTATGIIYVSNNLTSEQIDTKLVALLLRNAPKSLYGKFTTITGETGR